MSLKLVAFYIVDGVQREVVSHAAGCFGQYLLPVRCQMLLVQCRARDSRKFCQRGCAVAQTSLLTVWGSQRKLLAKERAEQSCGCSLFLMHPYFKPGGTPLFSQRDLCYSSKH